MNAREICIGPTAPETLHRGLSGASAGAEGAPSVEKFPPRERMTAWPKSALQSETEVGRGGGMDEGLQVVRSPRKCEHL